MTPEATQASAEAAPHLDQTWLRELVETLSSIHRPTASVGERRAAEWLRTRLRELGAEVEIEVENVHGTYWWPLGLAAGAAALAGLAAPRGHRALGAAGRLPAAAAPADEGPPRARRHRQH